MVGTILYPYARLNSDEVRWGSPVAYLDGMHTEVGRISDQWDAKARMRVELDVSVPSEAIRRIGGDGAPKAILNVSCKDSAKQFSSSADLIAGTESMTAHIEVHVPGHQVAQRLDLNAVLVMAVEGEGVPGPFKRRILADEDLGRISLDSKVDGFPTSAYSFKSHRLPDAPWRVVVSAEDLEATFVHSVRLHLNEDYALVQELIDGNPKPIVEQELMASIARVLIATASRLADHDKFSESLDSVAGDYPDSMAAAAQNVARMYLSKTLDGAVSDYRNSPEEFEYRLACAVGLMRVT